MGLVLVVVAVLVRFDRCRPWISVRPRLVYLRVLCPAAVRLFHLLCQQILQLHTQATRRAATLALPAAKHRQALLIQHGAGAGSVAPKTPSTKYFNSAQDPGQGQSSYYPTTTKPKSYTTTSAADPYYAPQASQANYSSQASQVNQDYYYDDGQYQDGYDDCYYDELGRPVDPYYDQQYDNGSGYSG